ncbi:MAG: ABC transporter permease [Roseitalea sp.]|nr:ABC transporter permease [Roseitalea sp.]MBO6952871.1 ABC transporter permease [Rhizobiaceae bacterium]MBO6593218.1 ABC transporter permease [Roseitalea sp.]MBO6600792.1 ABC transporter permease [Roseitalea sp.]MBO6612473.1 ABC transporter permease [Roseitalea sp.]
MSDQDHRSPPASPIVPPGNIAGQAMALVVAIMSFLACLTVGGVSLVGQSAATWQSQISREATVQIRPARDFDIETALAEAQAIAADYEGVRSARIIGREETLGLLEPWLGSGLGLDELPVPRLVVITIDETAPPDFAAMRAAITEAVPNATLDDHRAWVGRLVAMARTTTLAGLAVLALVMAALVMTVVFATRGALAGNHEVIEVLHFVGARAGFIARQFERRFLVIGLRGAAAGGAAAVAVFLVTGFWASRNLTSAENEQLSAFFGDFSMGAIAYVGVALVVVLVGALTMVTTRVTVLRVLYEIDEKRADPSL